MNPDQLVGEQRLTAQPVQERCVVLGILEMPFVTGLIGHELMHHEYCDGRMLLAGKRQSTPREPELVPQMADGWPFSRRENSACARCSIL